LAALPSPCANDFSPCLDAQEQEQERDRSPAFSRAFASSFSAELAEGYSEVTWSALAFSRQAARRFVRFFRFKRLTAGLNHRVEAALKQIQQNASLDQKLLPFPIGMHQSLDELLAGFGVLFVSLGVYREEGIRQEFRV
jgi:hypothetical protein